MISVELRFTYNYHPDNYPSRELSVWTSETGYEYYPLSYSLRDCFELICERLGWECEQYEIFDGSTGVIHAMKPELKLSTMNWWDIHNFTSATSTDSTNTYFYVDIEG